MKSQLRHLRSPSYGTGRPTDSNALPLRPRQRNVAFGAEDVAVEVGDPLAAARGLVEIADFGLDMRRHAFPVELRVAIDDVGGRIIAELAVDADFFELVVEGVGFSEVVGISEL